MLALPAATLILLREPGEVLMAQRNPALDFMGGFWVFPGGKVESSDPSPEQAARRELAEEAGLRLAETAELVLYARWITPVGLSRRFDTRFFLARASDLVGTDLPTVDDSEIVAARWATPRAVLEDGSRLALPTRSTLKRLAGFRAVEPVLAVARTTPVEPIRPAEPS